MKKILIAVAAAIPFLAVADNEVMSANTFGVLRLSPTSKVTPITANFGSVEVDGNAPIAVSNLLKTTNLASGDLLYVYNTDSSNWYSYILTANGWEACKVNYVSPDRRSSITVSEPQESSLINIGHGAFLLRQDTNATFYAFGQVQTGAVVTAISAGANLIGAPFGTNYNFAAARLYTDATCETSYTPTVLQEGRSEMIFGDTVIPGINGTPGDKIILFGTNGSQSEYWYNGTSWYNSNTKQIGAPEIPAGIGFWYYNASENPVYIKWGENSTDNDNQVQNP